MNEANLNSSKNELRKPVFYDNSLLPNQFDKIIENTNKIPQKIISSDKPKKKIFLCIKREHDETDTSVDSDNKMEKFRNKIKYKIHDKMEKDNIVRKLQVNYCNFLISFINEIIQKIIINDSYKNENIEEIINMNIYLFNQLDYRFKLNIRKDFLKKTINMKIKDIISPSHEFCNNYNISNKNRLIMKNIENKNNKFLNSILNKNFLYYFSEIYLSNKRNIELREGNESINIQFSNNIKMFDDLINKNENNEEYIARLKKIIKNVFLRSKYLFETKK